MTRFPAPRRLAPLLAAIAMAATGAAFAAALADAKTASAAPPRTLAAFRDEADFRAALDRWRDAALRLQATAARSRASALGAAAQPAPPPMVASPSALAKSEPGSAEKAKAADSITNVQTAGVDEGGIVKRVGDHLVVLRRGRLFSVRIGGDALAAADMAPAYAPGIDARGDWYDELLVSGRTIVVVGYSYARGGTEIGLFELGSDGRLQHRSTHHLRSNDYFSSRNYASRLIGQRLIFYTPTMLNAQLGGAAADSGLPALRRWHDGALPGEFERILPATRIHRSDDVLDPREPLALHTVTSCDLATAATSGLHCESSAVLGPAGRVFYVSAASVYVWTSPWSGCDGRRGERADRGDRGQEGGCSASTLFRLPLDGSAPSAIKTAGVPIDPMSFLEDDGEHLNVLVREAGRGEGMWGSERTRGAMALLRLPLAAFGDGRGAAQREHYRRLPAPAGGSVQNRFVGDWLLWGGSVPNEGGGANAWALRYSDLSATEPQALRPGHAVERIEAMGTDALLVGNDQADLTFSAVRLRADAATLAGRHVQPGARQGETRSHGFFYKAIDARSGIVGLPVLDGSARFGRGGGREGSASVVYLQQADLDFAPLGRLAARPLALADDGCVASCVDWYGNARPIFIGERVFALLGYELVEARLGRDAGGALRLDERRRLGFAPAQLNARRYSPFV